MSTESLTLPATISVRIDIAGRMQGLGVRPATARLALRHELAGWVRNTTEGLAVVLSGSVKAIELFADEFANCLPFGAEIDEMVVTTSEPVDHSDFRILDRCEAGTGSAAVPLDQIACPTCLAEVCDRSNRRKEYAFNSCTNCGPRYSIVEVMPYDRQATSMRHFEQCFSCEQEYRSPADRRFHAQTNGCPHCGPWLRALDESGQTFIGDEALHAACAALKAGRILALKGLGGYQLLVDATSTNAVRRLRTRKQRQSKPFAVLVGALAEAEKLALLSDADRQLLSSPAGPIVVVRRRPKTALCADVAPDFDSVGLLLPTTPLHALLCDRMRRPLVCTSGNREGEPLAYEEQQAEQELQGVADVWLHHNRPIFRPLDDSVVRIIAGEPCILRLARGHAPQVLPLPAGNRTRQLIALGGEQKAAFALSNGSQTVLGPHIGDLTNSSSCERWTDQLHSFTELYGVEMDASEVIYDCHPDYFATHWAQRFSHRQRVQHHHAHVAAVMLEHSLLDREVLGLAWDGTGYGDDGTVWGGECLRATTHDFHRVAWLRPFPLLGGARAVHEPWRTAVALIHEALGPQAALKLTWPNVTPAQVVALVDLAAKPQLFPSTSSMGRLFDAVAAITLGVAFANDEGRPAMLLEQACDRNASGSYFLPWNRVTGHIDWRPLVVAIVDDLRRGTSPGNIAMRFHRALAELVSTLASAHPALPVVMGGGVFQNAILGELVGERLASFKAGSYRGIILPPGDGGLAAGQLAVASDRIQRAQGEN